MNPGDSDSGSLGQYLITCVSSYFRDTVAAGPKAKLGTWFPINKNSGFQLGESRDYLGIILSIDVVLACEQHWS